MSYRSVVAGRVFVMVFLTALEEGDVERAQTEITRLQMALRERVYMVFVIPAGVGTPSAELRRRSIEMASAVLEKAVESIHAVILGDDLRTSAMRSMLRGMILLLPSSRNRVFIHTSIQAAIAHIRRELEFDVAGVARAAEDLLPQA